MWNPADSPFAYHLILRSILVPAGVTASVRALARATRVTRGMSTALALFCGFFAAYGLIDRDFTWLPHTVLSWVPWLALGGLLLPAFAARRGWHIAQAARWAIAACAAAVLLWPVLGQESLQTAVGLWGFSACAFGLLWSALSLPSGHGTASSAILFIAAATLAVIAPLSGSLLLGEMSGALACSLFILLVSGGLRTDAIAVDLAAIVLGSLVLDVWIYAEAPVRAMAPLLLSIGAGALAIRKAPERPGIRWMLLCGLAGLLPALVAGWMAAQAYAASAAAY